MYSYVSPVAGCGSDVPCLRTDAQKAPPLCYRYDALTSVYKRIRNVQTSTNAS